MRHQFVRPSPPSSIDTKVEWIAVSKGAAHSNGIRFDPQNLAIAMTVAPRRVPTIERCLNSIRNGQFVQQIHLFAEPDTFSTDWSRENVVVHQNIKRFGCYPNWLQAAQWLLAYTDCQFLMICEDDGIYCRGAAATLYRGLTSGEQKGCFSLYTPTQNYLAGGHFENGWFPLRAVERWGTVAQCFPRALLERFVANADWKRPDGTDNHIAGFLRNNGLSWYSHCPSLVNHIGTCSTLGHHCSPENDGIKFQQDFNANTCVHPLLSEHASKQEVTCKHPLISIVLPVHNGEQYLRESIESCLGQTYSQWELILVDDGSADRTSSIIDSYSDNRISLVRHGRNCGLPSALNSGFRQSQGELLTWTSCDNRYSQNALEVLTGFLQTNPECDMVYADYDIIDSNGKRICRTNCGSVADLGISNVIGACFLYKRRVYQFIGDYSSEARLAEDYDYWLRVNTHFRIKHLPLNLYDYRHHPGSLTSRFQDEIAQAAKAVQCKHLM